MKRFLLGLMCIAVMFSFFGCAWLDGMSKETTTYFRIHIRANSNASLDQDVKYKVRDAIIERLTPVLAAERQFDAAVRAAEAQLGAVTATANAVLRQEGFKYNSTAVIRQEDFPTRQYGDLVLPAGRYEALIVDLGNGSGDNWWCVAYPPLCFGQDDYVIKSIIAEIFEPLF